MKKLFIGLSAIMLALLSIPTFAAYEAYVINVRAQIEQALSVSPEKIDFGAVFPQEYLEKGFTIALSQSFMDATRVDDVSYVIKQKPKCWNNNPSAPAYAAVDYLTHQCPTGFFEMTSLCPYLSKTDGDLADGNDRGVPSYFQGTGCAVPSPDYATGYLSKKDQDISDIWLVDLKVPPVKGFAAQDWPAGCPLADAYGVELGCDLWVEIVSLSANPVGGPETRCGDGLKQRPNDALLGGPNNDGLEDCDGADGVPAGYYCTGNCELKRITECESGQSRACDTGEAGICSAGAETCVAGFWGECQQNQQATAEICNNQQDDDCDGKIDTADDNCWQCQPDETRACDTGEAGICSAGTKTCTAGFWGSCAANVGSTTEDCFNHLDDDCDGLADVDDPECKIACVEKGDVMLVLDRSGSIDEDELAILKEAAKGFVDILEPSDEGFHFGQTSFSTYGLFNLHLTGAESSIYAAIEGLTNGGYTNLYHGITLATEELKNTNTLYERPAVQDFMVIITDGIPNRPAPEENARQLAKEAADAARAAGIMIYVLGVDDDVDANYLRNDIANATGQYYPVADFDSLAAVLEEVADCH